MVSATPAARAWTEDGGQAVVASGLARFDGQDLGDPADLPPAVPVSVQVAAHLDDEIPTVSASFVAASSKVTCGPASIAHVMSFRIVADASAACVVDRLPSTPSA